MIFTGAAAAAGGLLDRGALDAALAWNSPWRIVVIGGVSAGKSSLVNGMGCDRQAVGLGGCTRTIVELIVVAGAPSQTFEVLDTPGIGGADARWLLGPLLSGADAAIWVIDGLQPITNTERDVLEQVLPDDIVLDVVVSKVDLVPPEDRAEVMERVENVASDWSPRSISWCCLRTATGLEALLERGDPRRQRFEIHGALQDLLSRLEQLSPRRSESRLRGLWRAEVAAARTASESAAAPGARLMREAAAANDRFERMLRTEVPELVSALGLPSLPGPVLPTASPLRVLLGRSREKKALVSATGRWLMEGEVAISEWMEALPPDGPRQAARAAVARALEAVDGPDWADALP